MWVLFIILVVGIIAAVIIGRKKYMQSKMKNLPNTRQGKCAEYIANALRNELGLTVEDDPYVYDGSKLHYKRVKVDGASDGFICISWDYDELIESKGSFRLRLEIEERSNPFNTFYSHSEIKGYLPIFFGFSEIKKFNEEPHLVAARGKKHLDLEWFSVAKRAMDEFLAKQ